MYIRGTLIAMVFVLSCIPALGAEKPAVELSFLTKNKKVIPLVCRYKTLTVTDIKLPDLVLTNRSSDTVIPASIEVVGKSGGEEIARFKVPAGTVKSFIDQVNPQFKKKLAEDRTQIMTGFGEMDVDAGKLSDSSKIGPAQCAILLLSKMLFFHNVGMSDINSLEILLLYDDANGNHTAELAIPITSWSSQLKYSFPLKGSIMVKDMPMNYLHHRSCNSQEFALDFLEVHSDKKGRLMTCRKPGASDKLTDYYIYRRDVFAAADGVVVDTADGFPEDETVNPAKWSDEESGKVITKLAEKIGMSNAVAGNYLVIEHGTGEYGFYAHLSQHTLKVKLGDKIKAGQVIAQVGGTGNSTEPHLHFQLMDSKDFLAANGLPIMFTELPADKMNQFFTEANSLASSDSLCVFVP